MADYSYGLQQHSCVLVNEGVLHTITVTVLLAPNAVHGAVYTGVQSTAERRALTCVGCARVCNHNIARPCRRIALVVGRMPRARLSRGGWLKDAF